MNDDNFAFPILTVDGVIFQLIDGKLTVLLIERTFEPFLGVWALPGGYLPREETSRQALDRVLIQKTGLSLNQVSLVEQPYAFDAPSRDPRSYAVTVMYMGLGKDLTAGEHRGMTNAQNPTFVPVAELPRLAFDHEQIVKFAHHRLKELVMNTNAISALMSKHFTLSQLQSAYEAIFLKKLDKRNFRKRIASLNLTKPTNKMVKDGAHRPARLYQFAKVRLQSFIPDF